MNRVRSFAPVLGDRPRVLILGSMPGVASLERRQYYAHPRNAYWRIMGDLFGAGPELPYPERLRRLAARGIALWDVLESCVRSGSLDSSIADASARPNDFGTLFSRNPSIDDVFFNGRKAAEVFRRRILPELEEHGAGALNGIRFRTLPSTSPAHAARSYAEKLAEWSAVQEALERTARAS